MHNTCLRLAAIALLATACATEPTGPAVGSDEANIRPAQLQSGAGMLISDGRTDGVSQLQFLWPIVSDRVARDQPFDATASPSVMICELVDSNCGEVVAEFPYRDRPGPGLATTRNWSQFEFYLATWATRSRDIGKSYRAIVRAYGLELGFVDIRLVRRIWDLRDVPSDMVGVVAGWPLPIPFRVEAGITPSKPCESATVLVGFGRGVAQDLEIPSNLRCGQRVPYAFQLQPGYSDLDVLIDGVSSPINGAFHVSNLTTVVARARPTPYLSGQLSSLIAAVDNLLGSSDRTRAFEELLALARALHTGGQIDVRRALDQVLAGIRSDAVKGPLLEAAESEIAGRLVQVSEPAQSSSFLDGPARSTAVVHVNGVNTDLSGAVANAVELSAVVREAGLASTTTYIAYNPTRGATASQRNAIALWRCIEGVLDVDIGTIVAPGSLDLLWALATTCPLVPDVTPDPLQGLLQLAGLPTTGAFASTFAQDLHLFLSNNVQVVLVPHSQGNMMVRDALAYPTVTQSDRALLSGVFLAPQGMPSASSIARTDCWMIEEELFEWAGVNACTSTDSPVQTTSSIAFTAISMQAIARISRFLCGVPLFPCNRGITVATLEIPGRVWLHKFQESYLADSSRDLLKRRLREHKAFLDAQAPPVPPAGSWCGTSTDFTAASLPSVYQSLRWAAPGRPLASGLFNDRIEYRPVDTGFEFGNSGAPTSGTATIRATFDARLAHTGSGHYYNLHLTTPGGPTWIMGVVIGSFGNQTPRTWAGSYTTGTQSGLGGPLGQGGTHLHDQGFTGSFGDYRFEYSLSNGSMRWRIWSLAGMALVLDRTIAAPGLNIASVGGMFMDGYMTSGFENLAWLDNWSIACLP